MSTSKDLNGEALLNVIAQLKEKRKELLNLFDKQNETIEKLHECWGGTTGDEAYLRLTKHSKNYDSHTLDLLDRRIKFLEEVRESYSTFEEGTSKTLDINSNITA